MSDELRERIKELMVDFGLNQTQLAKKTGIGISTISSILRLPKNGSKVPNVRLSTLEPIAEALECYVHVDFIDADQFYADGTRITGR